MTVCHSLQALVQRGAAHYHALLPWGPLWVKTGKSRSEQMFSGLPPKADSICDLMRTRPSQKIIQLNSIFVEVSSELLRLGNGGSGKIIPTQVTGRILLVSRAHHDGFAVGHHAPDPMNVFVSFVLKRAASFNQIEHRLFLADEMRSSTRSARKSRVLVQSAMLAFEERPLGIVGKPGTPVNNNLLKEGRCYCDLAN
jgi:hypothetical protein